MHVYRFVLVRKKEEDESEVFVNLWYILNRCYPKAKLQKFHQNNKLVVVL